ncbi:fasciclin-like arabinogalactan protein 21 [Rhodamnia argentea]|uniref:Fasciclin-like arabinogalactan protein 21 n=1 Tax=Rhodamnia argentea TaxID=178133 RepID=A0A8B8QGZ0_9MYRT|nr:fasciclin-like arabinogalactan protein 21 [Rhodamnia argentea]
MASCSWWPLPIYSVVSVALAFMAISATLRSTGESPVAPSSSPSSRQLPLNASRALGRAGFAAMAALLPIAPELFFSSPNATIFVIKDSFMANLSLSPWLMEEVLRYHASPLKLSVDDLLKMPRGSCLPTLLAKKNVVITRSDAEHRLVEINRVAITHPNVFLGERLAIHGVLRPLLHKEQDLCLVQSSKCDHNPRSVSAVGKEQYLVDWGRVIQSLSSNGFVSFAIGLQSVLDGILGDNGHLASVTVFAPADFGFVASDSAILERMVRFHILPHKYTRAELTGLPDKASLRTLLPGRDLKICRKTAACNADTNRRTRVAINGLEIGAPDICKSRNFVIHGISRALDIAEAEGSRKW